MPSESSSWWALLFDGIDEKVATERSRVDAHDLRLDELTARLEMQDGCIRQLASRIAYLERKPK